MNETVMTRKLIWIAAVVCFSGTLALAQLLKTFPAHWGRPPEIQTQDHVELPEGYGRGSSTLKHWIAANLAKDKASAAAPIAPRPPALYRQDFENLPVGALPDEFMVLGGEFAVKADGTNQFLELPGSPLDSFAVQFGPGGKDDLAVSARIFGTTKGRRAPTFGVGLGGVSGFRLQVSPAKKAVELLKDQDLKTSVPFDWKSGTWTHVRLQIRKLKDAEWKVEGKAWTAGEAEPKEWSIACDEQEEPPAGRASVIASPFSGTPIWFDDLLVERTAE